MEIRPPRKKKNIPSRFRKRPPLPIFFETPSGFVTDDSLSPVFRGSYSGYSVIVDNVQDGKLLYDMGYFGKGSLSRSLPNFGKREKGLPPVITESQWKRRKEWIEKIQKAFGLCPSNSANQIDSPNVKMKEAPADPSSCPKDDENSKSKSSDTPEEIQPKIEPISPDETKEVLVVADFNRSFLDPKPHLEHELVATVVEAHHLTLEEAFFLNYALGCLDIVTLVNNYLSPIECWELFKRSQKDFIESYVAYHHFRAKGWIVKPGLKYGGNFVLYSKGPSFYHASYIVIVENIGKPGMDGILKKSWSTYCNMNRIAEQSNKEIILCQVKWPSPNLDDYKLPDVIRHFKVKDCIIGRWNASTNVNPDE